MTARIVLGPDATRDQWLNARRTGITGTELSAIFGVLTYICTCGHRSYTYHDWTIHSLD